MFRKNGDNKTAFDRVGLYNLLIQLVFIGGMLLGAVVSIKGDIRNNGTRIEFAEKAIERNSSNISKVEDALHAHEKED